MLAAIEVTAAFVSPLSFKRRTLLYRGAMYATLPAAFCLMNVDDYARKTQSNNSKILEAGAQTFAKTCPSYQHATHVPLSNGIIATAEVSPQSTYTRNETFTLTDQRTLVKDFKVSASLIVNITASMPEPGYWTGRVQMKPYGTGYVADALQDCAPSP